MLRMIILPLIVASLTSCQTHHRSQPTQTTASCYQYQLMMTAPMPEQAMNRLKQQCENSASE